MRRRKGDNQTEGHPGVIMDQKSEHGSKIRRIEVTVGEETFSPVRYFTFRVGPFTASVDAGPEDDVEEIVRDVCVRLERSLRAEFDRKLAEHLRRVKECEAFRK